LLSGVKLEYEIIKSSTGRREMMGFALMLVLLNAGNAGGAGAPQDTLHFYIFGSLRCSHCRMLKSELEKSFNGKQITFYPISDSVNMELFDSLKKTVNIPVIPLTGIFKNGELAAVKGAYFDFDSMKDMVDSAYESGCFVILWSRAVVVCDTTAKNRLERMLLSGNPFPEKTKDMSKH
jgi:hypothetical protein